MANKGVSSATLGAASALVKPPTDAQVATAVSDWLDDHPEATTTVQDGSITEAKLDSNLQGTVAEVTALKSALSDTGIISETDVSFPETNTYYSTSGIKQSNASSVGTGFVAVNPGDTILFKLAEHTSFATISFYTAEDQYTFISGSAVIGESSTLTYVESSVVVPETALFFRACSWDNRDDCYLRKKSVINVQELKQNVETNKESILLIDEEINDINDDLDTKMGQVIEPSKPYPNQGYINTSGVIAGTGYDSYVTDFIPIEDTVSGIDYYLNHAGTTTLMVAFYSEYNPSNASDAFISGVVGTGDVNTMHKGTAVIPNGAKAFRAAQWNIAGVTDYYVRKRYTLDSLVSGIDANDKQSTDNSNSIKTINLKESIYKPFDFTGKKITAFGDSITLGVTSPGFVTGTPYIKYFANHVGATLNNMAISGSKIADNGQYSIYTRVTTHSETTDFIVIAGGTNDFVTNVELGSYTSTAGTDTFYGALKGICEALATNYPTTPVIWITPIPFTDRDPNTPNTAGYTLNQYRQAIYEIGTLYGHSVINGADLGMPTKQGGWNNAMCDDADGCHPTEDGHKLYARSLAGKLL